MLSRTCGPRDHAADRQQRRAHEPDTAEDRNRNAPDRAEAALVDLRTAHGGVDVTEAGVEGIVQELVVHVGGGDRGAETDQREREGKRAAALRHEMYEL